MVLRIPRWCLICSSAKNPDNQGYSISAGQRKLTRFLLDYHFNEQDIHWLRTKGMSEEFCEYLRTYKWKGDMYALPEGTVCYPHVQMVRIECDWWARSSSRPTCCRP